MPRHIEAITIEAEGRDKGKTFVITEMPAVAGEKWAGQLLILLGQSGADLDPEVMNSGMSGVAALAKVGAPLMKVLQDPSLDGWWDCVRYQHAPNHPLQPIIKGEACQIEEIATITQLRVAVLNMHLGFFSTENRSSTALHSPAIPTGSLPTRISRPRSAQ